MTPTATVKNEAAEPIAKLVPTTLHGKVTVKPHPIDGSPHLEVMFPNGYGASVVRNSYSYGGPAGLYELAVLNHKGALTYATPITDDVIGWLTAAKVKALLRRIAALEAAR